MRSFHHKPRAERVLKTRRWTGWRVFAVDIQASEDELVRLAVHCDRFDNPSPHAGRTMIFLTDAAGRRRSPRLDAFMRAVGIVDRCDDVREIEGRYFATKNDGKCALDFGPLSNVVVS